MALLDKRQADTILVQYQGNEELHKAWGALLRRLMAYEPMGPVTDSDLTQWTEAEWDAVRVAWRVAAPGVDNTYAVHDGWQQVLGEIHYGGSQWEGE